MINIEKKLNADNETIRSYKRPKTKWLKIKHTLLTKKPKANPTIDAKPTKKLVKVHQ